LESSEPDILGVRIVAYLGKKDIMFGSKKSPPAPSSNLTQQAGDEPAHIFDQTNGVLKHFEEHNSPVPASGSPHAIGNAMGVGGFARGH
jgi:hypothetical protein